MSYQLYDTWGFLIYLDVAESSMMMDRKHERYEPNKFKWLSDNLKSTDVFIDVGSNKGDFTLFAASRCKKVYSIEPHPDNIQWLNKSIDANQFSNVEVIEGCAIDVNGKVMLSVGAKSGHHSLVRQTNNTIAVDGFRLDSKITDDDSIVCKIDVEGAEKIVLAGMDGIMKNIRAFLIDVDSGDVLGVKHMLKDYQVVHRSGNELFFVLP